MNKEGIELTREDLYGLVWSQPTQKVAKELGISDVALSKICRKLHVPKPPRGYWRQIEVGLRVQPVPLPRALKTTPASVWITPTEPADPPATLDPEVAARVEPQLKVDEPIHVDDVLSSPHPTVRQTKHALEKAREDDYAKVVPPWDRPSLDIRVSRGSIDRALLIMDALVKAFVKRGYSIELGGRHTRIVIGGEKIRVRLTEKVERFEIKSTEKQRTNSLSLGQKEYGYRPTGKLQFLIEEYCSKGIKKNWNDHKREPLEEQLNEIVNGVIIVAAAFEVEHIRHQEQERQRIEEQIRRYDEQRRREEEEKRFKAVENQADLWIRSRNLRKFLRSFERAILSEFGEIDPDGPVAKWLAWAQGRIDLLDPFRNGVVRRSVENLNNPTLDK
jgi:hypothetical protein